MPIGGRPLVMANRIADVLHFMNGVDGALGEYFFLGDEGAVDVGDDQWDGVSLLSGHFFPPIVLRWLRFCLADWKKQIPRCARDDNS